MREIKEIKADYKNYLNLVKEMVIADFKVRYQGSVLGVLWSLLQPLMLFGVLLFVFSNFARFEIENYPMYLLLGIIMWNYFLEATSDSIKTLLIKAPIIKKVYFPRSIIIVSVNMSSFINFLFSLTVFIIFLYFFKIGIGIEGLVFLLYLIDLFICTLGTSFLISSIGTRYRDLHYIWPVLLRFGFWLTPIVYSISMVPKKYHFLLYLNPLTRIIQYSRESILNQQFSNLDGVLALNIVSIIIIVIGFFVFNKRSIHFTEEL